MFRSRQITLFALLSICLTCLFSGASQAGLNPNLACESNSKRIQVLDREIEDQKVLLADFDNIYDATKKMGIPSESLYFAGAVASLVGLFVGAAPAFYMGGITLIMSLTSYGDYQQRGLHELQSIYSEREKIVKQGANSNTSISRFDFVNIFRIREMRERAYRFHKTYLDERKVRQNVKLVCENQIEKESLAKSKPNVVDAARDKNQVLARQESSNNTPMMIHQ